jgi:hypothetical protein
VIQAVTNKKRKGNTEWFSGMVKVQGTESLGRDEVTEGEIIRRQFWYHNEGVRLSKYKARPQVIPILRPILVGVNVI